MGPSHPDGPTDASMGRRKGGHVRARVKPALAGEVGLLGPQRAGAHPAHGHRAAGRPPQSFSCQLPCSESASDGMSPFCPILPSPSSTVGAAQGRRRVVARVGAESAWRPTAVAQLLKERSVQRDGFPRPHTGSPGHRTVAQPLSLS